MVSFISKDVAFDVPTEGFQYEDGVNHEGQNDDIPMCVHTDTFRNSQLPELPGALGCMCLNTQATEQREEMLPEGK